MSLFGVFILVLVVWLTVRVGGRVACALLRLAPTLLLVAAGVVAGIALFGHGCDRGPASTEVYFVDGDGTPHSIGPNETPPDVNDTSDKPPRPLRAARHRTVLAQNQAAPAPPVVVTPPPPPVATPLPPSIETPASPSVTTPATPSAATPPTAPIAAPAAVTDSDRPAWVDAPGKLDHSVYSVSVKSGLFASVPECQRALDLEIQLAADHYIDEYLGDDEAHQRVAIPLEYLKQNVTRAEFGELVQSASVGPMHQIHALLEFDDGARDLFKSRQHQALVNERLWIAGAGSAGVLAFLGALYGYLKLDLRHGGARRGGLQLGATLLALIVVAGIMLARWTMSF